jgi:hypothetical protein
MIKTLVYEDLVPTRLTPDDIDMNIVTGAQVQSLYDRYRTLACEVYGGGLNRHMISAVGRLRNLDTIEYFPGFHGLSQPLPTVVHTMQNTLKIAAGSCVTMNDWLWENRFEVSRPAMRASDWDAGLYQFHLLLRAALLNVSRTAPLIVKMITQHNEAFYDPPAGECLPTDNLLHHLDVQYLGLGMSHPYAIQDDLNILCDTWSTTAFQFMNLRSLKLSGARLYLRGLLNLKSLGQPGCVPSRPYLRSLELSNARIDRDAARRVNSLHVHVTLHNILLPTPQNIIPGW